MRNDFEWLQHSLDEIFKGNEMYSFETMSEVARNTPKVFFLSYDGMTITDMATGKRYDASTIYVNQVGSRYVLALNPAFENIDTFSYSKEDSLRITVGFNACHLSVNMGGILYSVIDTSLCLIECDNTFRDIPYAS